MTITIITLITLAILFTSLIGWRILRKTEPKKKTIYRVGYTVNKSFLPNKKLYTVSYIHNQDIIPVGRKPKIRSCVI